MINEEQQKKDERYMQMALDEAHLALEAGEIPIGAVVAEMQAITAAANTLGGKYLTECTLYVTVEPCTMCAGAIGWAQIPRIVYGAPDDKRGYHLLAPHAFHPKAQVTQGVLEDECRELMQNFFKAKR